MRDVRWAGAGRWPATCAGTARAATALRGAGCEALRCGQLWAGPEESPAAGGGRDRPGEARTAAARGRSLHRAYDSSWLCAGEQQAPGQTSGPSAQPSP